MLTSVRCYLLNDTSIVGIPIPWSRSNIGNQRGQQRGRRKKSRCRVRERKRRRGCLHRAGQPLSIRICDQPLTTCVTRTGISSYVVGNVNTRCERCKAAIEENRRCCIGCSRSPLIVVVHEVNAVTSGTGAVVHVPLIVTARRCVREVIYVVIDELDVRVHLHPNMSTI